MQGQMMKGAMSVAEFCQWAGIGRTHAYAQVKLGRLRLTKCGHKTLIKYADAQDWLESLSQEQTP